MFAVIAWRFKDRKEFLFEEATEETVGGAVPKWKTFPTDTENLFIVHTFGDDGAAGTTVEPCE